MRAAWLLLLIKLDEKLKLRLGDLLNALESKNFEHREYWCLYAIPRINGEFHTDKAKLQNKVGSEPPPKLPGPIIKSTHPGTGMGIFVFYKPSQLDRDFTYIVWSPEMWSIQLIERMIKWSQKATHDMLGRPFGGKMPYAELQDFM